MVPKSGLRAWGWANRRNIACRNTIVAVPLLSGTNCKQSVQSITVDEACSRSASNHLPVTFGLHVLRASCFVLSAEIPKIRTRHTRDYSTPYRQNRILAIWIAHRSVFFIRAISIFFLSLLSGNNLYSLTGIILGTSNLHTAYRGREMLVISCRLLLSIRGKLTVMQTASTAVRCLNPSAMMFCVTGASQMQA